jgi:hypothetical protein
MIAAVRVIQNSPPKKSRPLPVDLRIRFQGQPIGFTSRAASAPTYPLPKFSPPRRVPHGVILIGRLFDEGTLGRVGIALEPAFNVSTEHPRGF